MILRFAFVLHQLIPILPWVIVYRLKPVLTSTNTTPDIWSTCVDKKPFSCFSCSLFEVFIILFLFASAYKHPGHGLSWPINFIFLFLQVWRSTYSLIWLNKLYAELMSIMPSVICIYLFLLYQSNEIKHTSLDFSSGIIFPCCSISNLFLKPVPWSYFSAIMVCS